MQDFDSESLPTGDAHSQRCWGPLSEAILDQKVASICRLQSPFLGLSWPILPRSGSCSILTEKVNMATLMTVERIVSCYDLMDAAYDAPAIAEYSRSVGHVPLIDKNPRGDQQLKNEMEAENLARKTLNLKMPEDLRYNERTTAERANSRMKDDFGACKVRVRGHSKVACHLCFGVLVLAADQLMKLFG